MIRIFAFRNTIAARLVQKLVFSNTYYLESNQQPIEHFVNKLIENNPKFIIGLGSYSGRDKNELRLETICSNKFRNNILGNKLIQLNINYFLQPTNNVKLARGIGTSWCNLISYKIMSAIDNKQLASNYTFIHIPKSMPLHIAIDLLDMMLENMNLICSSKKLENTYA